MNPSTALTLGLTSDLVTRGGELRFPGYPLADLVSLPNITVRHIEAAMRFDPEDLSGLDVLISVPHGAPLDAAALARASTLAAVVRVGVGYEDCDLEAMTSAGIALAIPAAATKRPAAAAALALLLALATRLLDKHRLSHEGKDGWRSRATLQGRDLRGKSLGLVGCGAIGRELSGLARPLGMAFAVYDPALADDEVRTLGAEPLPLHQLMSVSDFISIHCPLTPATRHLIDHRYIKLMKRDAYLINTARGGVIDQAALVVALGEQRIGGAGLDVFDPEPLPRDHPLLHLPHVILSGHALNWTRELDADLGRANCRAVAAVAAGRAPEGVVNRRVLDDPRFQMKLRRFAAKSGPAPVVSSIQEELLREGQ